MIVFAGEALADLERIFEFNFARNPATALDHIEKVRSAVLVLQTHPEIGHPVPGSTLRELVISYGKSGYVALYEYSSGEGLLRVAATAPRGPCRPRRTRGADCAGKPSPGPPCRG